MAYKAPGKHYRKGISHKEFFKLFPDDDAARSWFMAHRWPHGVRCPRCGSDNVRLDVPHKTMEHRCGKSKKKGGCGKWFSVRTVTFMEASHIGYQDWLFALFLVSTNLKSVSSMKLHRDLGRTQRTAWHVVHRLRKALSDGDGELFKGPVESDETYVGGRRRNMSNSKRKELTGRGPVGKTAVIGVKDRDTNRVSAKVVSRTDAETLTGFVMGKVAEGAAIYTDDATAYSTLPNHEAIKHSVAEYVRGRVNANGIESFWSTLEARAQGHVSPALTQNLHRYVDEFVGRHNMRELDTLEQLAQIASKMDKSQLRYKDLVA